MRKECEHILCACHFVSVRDSILDCNIYLSHKWLYSGTRFLLRFRQATSLQNNTSEIVAATKLASSAKECVLHQIYVAAFRKKKTYRNILTPRQAILYHKWLFSNRTHVKNITSERRKRLTALVIQHGGFIAQGSDRERNKDWTLEQLCRQMEENLKISKTLARWGCIGLPHFWRDNQLHNKLIGISSVSEAKQSWSLIYRWNINL